MGDEVGRGFNVIRDGDSDRLCGVMPLLDGANGTVTTGSIDFDWNNIGFCCDWSVGRKLGRVVRRCCFVREVARLLSIVGDIARPFPVLLLGRNSPFAIISGLGLGSKDADRNDACDALRPRNESGRNALATKFFMRGPRRICCPVLALPSSSGSGSGLTVDLNNIRSHLLHMIEGETTFQLTKQKTLTSWGRVACLNYHTLPCSHRSVHPSTSPACSSTIRLFSISKVAMDRSTFPRESAQWLKLPSASQATVVVS